MKKSSRRVFSLVLTAVFLLTAGWALSPVKTEAKDIPNDVYKTFDTSKEYYLWLKEDDSGEYTYRWNADGTKKGNVIHLDIASGGNCKFDFTDAGSGYYGIRCTESRLYVDTDKNDKDEKRVLHQYHSDLKQDNQRFRFIPVEGEDNTYYIQIKNSGLYVGLNGYDTPERGRILVTADSEHAWKWVVIPTDFSDLPDPAKLPVPMAGEGYPENGALTFMMNPLGFTRGISVHNDAIVVGNKVHLWALGHTCKVTAEYVSSQDAYRLRSFDYFETTTSHWNTNDFVWDVDDQSKNDGATIHIWDCAEESKASTLWRFYPVPDMEDVYYVQNVNSGLFVSPETDEDKDGVTLKQTSKKYPWEIHWLFSEGETFYGYNKDHVSDSINPGNWMSKLPDDMLLSQVNMPGTHDSASTRFYTANSNFINEGLFQMLAQVLYLDEQLNAGVRAWDIRLSLWDDKKYDDPQIIHGEDLIVCHNRNDDYINLSQVLDTATEFLEKHPQETVVMQLFGQGIIGQGIGEEKHQEVRYMAALDVFKMLYGLTDEDAENVQSGTLDPSGLELKYPVYVSAEGKQDSEVPTLGDVRGKIVLLNHLGVPDRKLNSAESLMYRTLGPNIQPWVSTEDKEENKCVQKVKNTCAYIQDVYNLSSASTKMDYVNAAFEDINGNDDTPGNYETDSCYVLNFASAQDKWDISKSIYESLMQNSFLDQVDSGKAYTGMLFCNEIDPLLSRRIYMTNFSTDGTPLSVRISSRTAVFEDVGDEDYYAEPVSWAVDHGITNGTSDSLFSPDNACLRSQVTTFLWRAAEKPESSVKAKFQDVEAGSFYENAVDWAAEKGITQGVSEKRFAPDDTCTRAQIVTFLWRYAGMPEAAAAADFMDVPSDAYYAKAVAWAEEKGITQGVGDHSFGSDDVCTRAQIVTFLYRYFDGI